MVHRNQISLLKFAALLLATAAVTPAIHTLPAGRFALAQSFGDNPNTFPIPSTLPAGTRLNVDGSTSMAVTNAALAERFEKQYPDIDVGLAASRTDEAMAALLKGELDLVATGRPLTDSEKAQGLVAVPLEREKLAILLGPDNPFAGNLSFEQFAQIFRGEITNWSQVGGPDVPIRVVDRPDYSDTRRALSTYEVFTEKPFATGSTADPVAVDETDAVVEALGADGIGYAVVSQVSDRPDVRILSMHGTLPDDPRYPYSQYRAFVYKQGATPAVLAFLGFVTTPPGQEVVVDAGAAAGAAADATASGDATTGGTATGDTASAPDETAAVGAAGADATADDEPTALVPGGDATAAAERRGFPWWLLLLPLLAGLLWWLFKGRGGGAAVAPAAVPVAAVAGTDPAPRIVLTPRNCRDGYAYWEIPRDRRTAAQRQGGEQLQVRLYDVTDRPRADAALPPHTAEFDCVQGEPDLHLPIPVDNRDYCAEIGYLTADRQWLSLARSAPVRVPACPAATPLRPGVAGAAVPGAALGAAALGAAALGAAGVAAARPRARHRIVLTPRHCRDAYAYWELDASHTNRPDNAELMVRLYDVTGRATGAALPDAIAEFKCPDSAPDMHLPIQVDDRDYCVELGYRTPDHGWSPLAQSDAVRVPACPQPGTEGADRNAVALGGAATLGTTGSAATAPGPTAGMALPGAAALGAAALGAGALGAAALGATGRTATTGPAAAKNRMVLAPRHRRDIYAYWEVAPSHWEQLQQQGGQTKMVRLYDVTNRLPSAPLPSPTAQFEWVGEEPDLHLPIPMSDRDYVAEVGYLTGDHRWLPAAKSNQVRVPADLEEPAGNRFPGAAIAGAAAGAAALGVAAGAAGQQLPPAGTAATAPTSRLVLTPRTSQKAYAYWEVPDTAKGALKAEGGQRHQLRVYDVTDIDVNKQPPHSVLTYDVAETDCDRVVPLPQPHRDYVAEIGYEAADGSWLELARSLPVRAEAVLAQAGPSGVGAALGVGAIAGGLGAAAVGAVAPSATAAPVPPPLAHPCALQTVTVHSRDHAFHLDAGQMAHIQNAVAAQQALERGLYVLRLRDGVFNYDSDDTHPGEPFVLLWIYGGTVVNQKTGVPVNATWSTLNGYADTLTLDVRDPAQVRAFFMDTYPDDNAGEVTLQVIKL